MSWSKVKQSSRKPIGWWWHKIWCEFWYWFEQIIYSYFYHNHEIELFIPKWCTYYYHLNAMCKKYNINLYGEKI